MENKNFFIRLIIANTLILIIVFGTFYSVYNFLNSRLKTTLQQRYIINTFYNSVNSVSINLYRSAMLDDSTSLTEAALSSNQALGLLDTLEKDNFSIQTLRKDYNDFFRYTVATTTLSLEHRLHEAKDANAMSQLKLQKLIALLNEIRHSIDQKHARIITMIETFMAISSFLLIVVVIVNIRILSRSFLLIRAKEGEQAAMINALGDGVYGVNKDGNCTFINQSALNILQFSEDEVLGKDQHLLFHHHHADHSPYPQHDCPIHFTLMDRQIRHVQETFIRKDGSFFPVSVTVAPVGDEDGIVVFQDISSLVKKIDTLDHFANYDNLTGLPNRRLFMILADKKIVQSKRTDQMVAIAFLDLDGFKQVNDIYGHDMGDYLLKEVAKRFETTLRKSDIIARFGGDEFVVLLDTIKSQDEIEQILNRIIEDISAPFLIYDFTLNVGVSIGYTLFPEDDSNLKILIKHADNAMYEAKQSGKGVLKRFTITNAAEDYYEEIDETLESE